MSTTTESGMNLANDLFPKLTRFFFPLDFTWAVGQAFHRLKPKLLILVELEVWPNLIAAAQRFGCPVVIVNGRLSDGSFRGYRRLWYFLRSSFASLDLVAAQDATYAERFVAMGTPSERVFNVGNLKFDGAQLDRCHPEIDLRRRQLGLTAQHLVWVVGSTQSPEEQYAIDTYKKLNTEFPNLRMLIVPRHPDRFEEVAGCLSESGLRYRRRSESQDISADNWEVMLGDSVGELRWWWGMADIAFVGGSFGDRGGQNMIEPAGYGVSTAVGPNTKNFRDTMRMLREADAITELRSPSEMIEWAESQLRNSTLRTAVGARAAAQVASQRGALEKTLRMIAKYVADSQEVS